MFSNKMQMTINSFNKLLFKSDLFKTALTKDHQVLQLKDFCEGCRQQRFLSYRRGRRSYSALNSHKKVLLSHSRHAKYVKPASTASHEKSTDKITEGERQVSVMDDTTIPDPSFGRRQKPFYFRPTKVKVDYNIKYSSNTFITASRAISDYLLKFSDLEDLRKTAVRTAYSESAEPPDYCYLKSDVEERALERWGSMEALERERDRRREAMLEDERYRKGLSALIGHLKKTVKDQTKLEQEKTLFGGPQERLTLLKGSAKVVVYAVAANLLVTCFKFSAYLYTGSASMLSEAVHSFADAANQCILALGILKSIKEPSPDHPYGWSIARYVYSLISGVGIFFLGCGFTVYHGITELINPTPLESLGVAFAVLGGSAFVESLTLIAAFKQVLKSARESGMSFREYVIRGRDPNAVAVLLEDSAAVAGVIIASASLGLASYTNYMVFDAIGSIGIGALLGAVAVFLIRRNADFLTSRSIDPVRLRQIIEVLENDIMVRSIHDVKATELGADTVRFKAEINFDGREVTRVHINRLDLNALLKEVKEIKTTDQLEQFVLEHGEQIIDVLGSQVDRIEKNIKDKSPEVRHVDLEIL